MESNKQVDFILFDLDGTLVDSRLDISAAINHGLERLGADPRPVEEIAPLIGQPLDDIFAALLPAQLRATAPRGASYYRPFYLEHCADHSVLYEGVELCLSALGDYPLAVATTKRTDQALAVIRAFELEGYFEHVVGCDAIPHKPDPAVLLLAAQKLRREPTRGLMVGDTVFDIEAACRCSMASCGVSYGIGAPADLEAAGAKKIVDSLAELTVYVRGLK